MGRKFLFFIFDKCDKCIYNEERAQKGNKSSSVSAAENIDILTSNGGTRNHKQPGK